MKNASIILLFIFILHGCNEKSIETVGVFRISGKITNSLNPVSNAIVSVDSSSNWKTTTNHNGEFQIDGVTSGKHLLKYSYKDTDSSYVEDGEDITVNEDIILNNLKLPIPPQMGEPTEVETNSILLKWNLTDATDFREYKLYRKNSPGLDETSGELVYVSTSRSDTLFYDSELTSGETYYYRVYILNEFGSLGGSNIVNVKTATGNIIPNGDFENANSLDNWQINRGSGSNYYTVLTDTQKAEGNYSLLNINPLPFNTHTILKPLFPIKLIPEKKYKLSCWFKAEGKYTDIGALSIGIFKRFVASYAELNLASGGGAGDTLNIDWTYKEVTFLAPNVTDFEFEIYIPVEKFWLDNISLELIE